MDPTDLIDELKDGKADGQTKTTAEDKNGGAEKETESSPKKSNGDAKPVVATTISPDKGQSDDSKVDGADDHLDHPEKWATGQSMVAVHTRHHLLW